MPKACLYVPVCEKVYVCACVCECVLVFNLFIRVVGEYEFKFVCVSINKYVYTRVNLCEYFASKHYWNACVCV